MAGSEVVSTANARAGQGTPDCKDKREPKQGCRSQALTVHLYLTPFLLRIPEGGDTLHDLNCMKKLHEIKKNVFTPKETEVPLIDV